MTKQQDDGIVTRLASAASGYKLNARDLEDLATRGLEPGILQLLRRIEDRRFYSRDGFLAMVRSAVGPAIRDDHERLVIAHAKRLSLRKLRHYCHDWIATYFGASRIALPVLRAVLLQPVPFTLWFRGRALMLRLARALTRRPFVEGAPNANEAGFRHNLKQLLSFLPGHRNRTERLLNVLRSIQHLDPRGARVLCVGPRNEAEILLMRLYGFRATNIEAIDLFSYSPGIRTMDMNALRYPDDYFDVYYSSAVIKYSPDIRRTVKEAIRVTRRGGIMAFGFMFGTPADIVPNESQLLGGVQELLSLFGTHVGWVYWKEELFHAPGDVRATVIFCLEKLPSTTA